MTQIAPYQLLSILKADSHGEDCERLEAAGF